MQSGPVRSPERRATSPHCSPSCCSPTRRDMRRAKPPDEAACRPAEDVWRRAQQRGVRGGVCPTPCSLCSAAAPTETRRCQSAGGKTGAKLRRVSTGEPRSTSCPRAARCPDHTRTPGRTPSNNSRVLTRTGTQLTAVPPLTRRLPPAPPHFSSRRPAPPTRRPGVVIDARISQCAGRLGAAAASDWRRAGSQVPTEEPWYFLRSREGCF